MTQQEQINEEYPLGTRASMDVTALGIDGATAVVWLDATGRQIAAERFPYGGGRIHLYAPSVSYGDIYGENTIAFVTGGDLECVRDVCEQTGGEAVVTVTFEIHRGA